MIEVEGKVGGEGEWGKNTTPPAYALAGDPVCLPTSCSHRRSRCPSSPRSLSLPPPPPLFVWSFARFGVAGAGSKSTTTRVGVTRCTLEEEREDVPEHAPPCATTPSSLAYFLLILARLSYSPRPGSWVKSAGARVRLFGKTKMAYNVSSIPENHGGFRDESREGGGGRLEVEGGSTYTAVITWTAVSTISSRCRLLQMDKGKEKGARVG
ncbi:hypothetical protein GALMADRAFT_1050907 [Galerina marginata CBS 339.88]|uniref:Uncharacterized protein n=1 Tax=Galerina marginata (strain CBS 339.88) TaxID=685588 RepID=A0A067SDJ0_GALM3|nr:hypothetical protein GALMADRAFT_1050907 [Galerina marginata CBS 339.88]